MRIGIRKISNNLIGQEKNMANTEVLLVKYVDGLGSEGEQVSVKPGYARNFLFPQKMALPVNRANKKQIEALMKSREIREVRELTTAEDIKAKMETMNIAVAVKTGQGGKLFGTVTAGDLLEKYAESGLDLPKKAVHLQGPVKELGKHVATVRLHSKVKFEIEFDVVSINPVEV